MLNLKSDEWEFRIVEDCEDEVCNFEINPPEGGPWILVQLMPTTAKYGGAAVVYAALWIRRK